MALLAREVRATASHAGAAHAMPLSLPFTYFPITQETQGRRARAHHHAGDASKSSRVETLLIQYEAFATSVDELQ